MAIKIENQYEGKLPRNALTTVESVLASVPREHLRGVERLRLVNAVTEPRALMAAKGQELPGLYHPKQGVKGAWFEIAITPLVSANKPFHKRIIPRLSFRGGLPPAYSELKIGRAVGRTFTGRREVAETTSPSFSFPPQLSSPTICSSVPA